MAVPSFPDANSLPAVRGMGCGGAGRWGAARSLQTMELPFDAELEGVRVIIIRPLQATARS